MSSLSRIQVGMVVMAISMMGIAMPSCPGQAELKQQVETLQQSNNDLAKKVVAINHDLQQLTSDMAQVKQLFPQMTGVLQAQKAKLDELDMTIKNMTAAKAKKR